MMIHRAYNEYAMNPFRVKHTKESMNMIGRKEKEEMVIKEKNSNARSEPLLQ